MEDIDIESRPIPFGGSVPFEAGFKISEPRKKVITSYSPDTKQRVNRNINESPLERMRKTLTQDRYGMCIRYLECRKDAYGSRSYEIKERHDGGGGNGDHSKRIDAKETITRCGQMMENDSYEAVRLFLVEEMEVSEVASEITRKFGSKGWSPRNRVDKLGSCIDEMSSVWRSAVSGKSK